MELVTKCLFPFAWLMDQFAYISLKAVGIDIREKDDNVTEEDIMYMVNEGHEQGVLEASEAEMITNIFEFDDKVAADIMTHRTAVIALDGEMTLKEALDFVVKEANYSRFPVYSEDIDNIIGILHMRDTDSKDHLNTPIAKIKGLLRSPHFIPETKNINALFKEMQSQKIHIELVVDEYGQLAGIVTMEDILEEIVGNILDEYDKEEPDIVSRKNGTYELGGQEVTVKDRKAVLKDGTLAGSATNLFGCMCKAIEFGVPVDQAIFAATRNPARSIGIYDRTGSVHTGKEADLLLVTENFELKRVI